MIPTEIVEMTDAELYAAYQDAKEHGPVVRIDDVQLEIAERWEARIEADHEPVRSTLTDLIAIERDRLLGYLSSELHADPLDVLRDADDALEAIGVDPLDVIWPDDRDRLGLPMHGADPGDER